MRVGVLFSIVSALVFSVTNVLVKEVSSTIPAAEIAFFRGLIGTVIIVLLMRRAGMPFSRNGVPMLLLRGALGGLYMIAYFYTLSKIPLSDASILSHLSPVFAIVLSSLLLRERLPGRTAVIVPIVFAGAMLLIKPHQFSSYSVYALAGLLSAFLSAAASVSIRYLTKSHSSYEIVFYFVAASTLVAVPFMRGSFVIPDATQTCYLLAIGVISLLGQLFLTKAFASENAAVVQVVGYFGILLNVLWGYWLWNEIPDLPTAIGGIIIVAGCIALFGKRKKRQTEGGI